MKKQIVLFIISHALIATSCSKSSQSPEPGPASKQIVKGRVVDTKGHPLAATKIIIENTVLYNSYVYATTDASGNYQVSVPSGSWHASASINREFAGIQYRIELAPDNDDDFAGSDGAIRNFSWKLSGLRPRNSGYYGASVAVYPEPGDDLQLRDVILELTPDGLLIDGSQGVKISRELKDIGGGEDGITDVPLGRYRIAAKNKVTGEDLTIRLRNKGNYEQSVTALFESGFTGAYSYQAVVQVR